MIPTAATKKLRAFKNDPKVKSMMIKEIKWHMDQDAIKKGIYGEGEGDTFKGCAVGCSINSLNRELGKNYGKSDYSVYEKELGIPESLAALEDTLFEGMSLDSSKTWPLEFIKAIPIGVDLSLVAPKFIVFVLNDVLVNADDDGKKAINTVIGLWQKVIMGDKTRSAAWSAAESAAESAARSATWSAAESAARSAAWSAAESAAESAARSATWSAARSATWSAAESAARSAARSATWSAARSAAYGKYKNHLIKLLKTASVK